MYIQKLTLERFRGATNLSMDLGKQLNLFAGANGAGKYHEVF
jgi:recombinational DNA repair ATPase RecF